MPRFAHQPSKSRSQGSDALRRINYDTFTKFLNAGFVYGGQVKKLHCQIPIDWCSFSNDHSHRAMKL